MLNKVKTRFFVLFFLVAALVFGEFPGMAQEGYISARGFAEAQGIAYQWFPIQKVLVMRKGLRSVKLSVNSRSALVDEVETQMPAPVIIQDGQLMVPAAAIARFFSATSSPNIPPTMTPVAVTPAPAPAAFQPPVNNPAPPAIEIDSPAEAVLVALRHSSRDDHTRVVLEFSDQITYKTEFKDGIYRLNIMGCRNLIPTKRTNPAGRDISKLDINSGPDRKGLILTFHMNQKTKQPTIETVGSPFRMIISFAAPDIDPTQATATPAITAAPPAVKPEATGVPVAAAVEKPPEINIEVPAASLNNPAFAGRTIIIDAGHGGSDKGFVFPGRPEEKQITLSIANHLQKSLENLGLKAVLIRTGDVDMPHSQRIAIANKNGGDLYISLHVGGSNDTTKSGFAVYSYTKEGTAIDEKAQGLNYDAIYNEWLKNTRFDLAEFMARKVMDRLQQHLKIVNRGVMSLPLLPLKFITSPAILVETGMLSDATEGKNLISENYKKAIGQSIANAVVDFFNGIVINP